MSATTTIVEAGEAIELAVRRHTALRSFADLVGMPGRYRPTFYVGGKAPAAQAAIVALANAYDEEQARRGDSRRAYRRDF